MCAGEFMVFEHVPALGRFGDANTTDWLWDFPGGSINASGAPVPPSVRSQADPGAIYFLTPGTYVVTLRAKHDCCGWSKPIRDTIYVLPKPQVTILGPNEVCATGPMPTYQAVPAIPLSIDPDPEFRWYINGIPQTFNWIPYSANGHLFTPSSLNNGDVIKVEIRSTAPLRCFDPAISFATKTITVSAPSQGGFAYINAPGITQLNVCPGEQHTVGVVGQSVGSYASYQWQVSTDGGVTWTNVLSGVTQSILTAPITVNGIMYRVQVTNGSCAPAYSTPVTFYLNAGANPGVASVDPNTDTICAGQSANLSVTGFSGSIVWQYTTTPWIVTSWVTTSYTSPNITFPNITQTTYFRVRAYIPGGGPCSEAFSNIVQVTVIPSPVAGTILVDPNPACSGSNVLLTLTGYTGDSIRWQQLVGGVWTNVGPNSDSWLAGPITGTTFYRALVYNKGCGPAITAVATVNIVPGTNYSVNLAVSQNPICQGDAVTFTAIPVGAPPSPTFQFYVNGTPVIGAGNTYTTTTLNNGDQVHVEMQVTSTCGSGTFVSNTITMTVNPRPTVTISGPSGSICQGANATFTATPNPATATVQWYVNGTFTGATGTTFTTNSLNDGDQVYAVAIQGTCSSAPSNTITVDVDPAPIIVISADRTTICANEPVTFTAVTYNAGAFPTFQWQIDNGAGWTNIPGATGSTYTSSTLTNGSVIRCLVSPSGTGCSGTFASNPITITVHPIPTVTITASATTICAGQTVTFTATPNNAGPNPQYQWYINNTPVGPNNPVFTTSSLNSGDIVSCVITSTYGCSDATLSRSNLITMTVNPIPNVLISPQNPRVCAGDPVTFTAIVTNGTPTPLTYEWYVNGVPQGVNNSTFGPVVLNNGDQVTAQVITAAGCTSAVSAPSTVQAVPLPVVTISASATTVCAGQSVTFTASVVNGSPNSTYDWQVNGTSQGVNSPVFTYAPANGDVVRCIVTTDYGCQSAPSNSITLTVNPIPTVTVSAAPGTTVCAGTAITFTATPTGAGPTPTYQWYLNGNPVGTNAPTFILSNPQNGDVVTVRVTSTAGCTGPASVSAPLTLTVNPAPTVTLTAVPSGPICAGQTVTFSATAIPGATYNWYLNGVVVQSGASASYTTSTLANGDQVWVRATSAVGCLGPASAIYTAIVNPIPSVSITATPNPTCPGTAITFTALPTNAGPTPTYNWYVNGNLVQSGPSSTYTSSSLANGDQVHATVQSSAGCLSAASNTITVSLYAVPTVSVSVAPGTTVCQGTAVTFTATVTNGGASPTYQWYLNGNPVGANSPTFILSNPANGDQVYVRVTSTNGCTGPTAVSTPITLTVNPQPVATLTAIPSGPICGGQTVNFTATTFAGATYTWYVNGNIVQTGTSSAYSTNTLADGDQVWVQVTSAAGCTGPISNIYTATVLPVPSVSITISQNPVCPTQPVTFTAIPTNAGSNPTYNWYVNGTLVASGTTPTYTTASLANGDQVHATVVSSGGCLSAPSNTITVTVSPIPTVTLSASASSVCQGTSVTFTATPTNAGPTPTYNWYVNSLLVASTPSPTYTTSNLPPGNNTVYVQVISSAGCTGPASQSNAVNVLVEATPNVAITASATTICPGQSVQFIATASAPVTYQWYLNGNPIPGATANTYTSSTLNNGDVVYVQVTTPGGCVANSNSIAITVQGQPTVTVSVNPNPPAVCQGQTIVFTATAANAGPSPSFQWYVNNVAVGTNSPVFSSSTLQNGDVVTVRVTSSGGCTGASSLSAPVLVTVYPNPSVQIQASANPICAGQTVIFTSTVQNAGPNPTYQWQVNGVNVPGANGPSFLTSTLNHGDVVQLLVTSSQGCPAGGQPSNQILMTVHPVPSITLTQTPAGTVCRGSQVTFTVGGAPAGASYSWTLNGNPLPGVTTGTYITDSLRNGDVVAVTVTSAQGCVSNTASITASVINGPLADFTPPAPKCVYETFDFQNGGSTGAGLLYLWDFGTSATPQTSNLENPTGIRFSTPGNKSVTLTITDPATGCSHSVTKTVYVKPQPTAAIGPVPNLCYGLPYNFTQVGTNDPTALFVWSFLPDGQPGTSLSANPVGITFPTPGQKTAQLIVIVDGCADTAQVTFTVDSALRVDLGPDRVLCTSDLPITLDAGPGGQTYEWTLNGQPIGGNTQTLTVTQGGIYAVRVTTATGCVGQDAVNIQVSSQIPVDLGPDVTLCASGGTSVTLYSGYPGATHTWTKDGQVIPGATADSLVVTQPGVYGVTVQPAGSSCIGQDFVVVRFDSTITVNLGPDVFYCTSDPIQPLVAPTVGGATYVWYHNGLTVPGANGPTLTPSGSGTYVVVVLAGACIGTDTVEVTITPSVQVNLPDTIRFCPSNPLVELEAPYYPGATYLWTLNGTQVAQGVGLYRLVDTRAGVWRVSITTASGCSGSDVTVAQPVPAPRPDFETEPPLPARLASSNPVVRFINTSQNITPGTFFRWDFGDSTTSTEKDPVHRFPTAGTFYVTLYMYNGNCVDSIRKGPIIITPVDASFIPSAFSPNGDGVNDQLVFPALGYRDYEFTVYNRWGQVIFQKKLGQAVQYWDGNEYEGGMRKPAPEGVYVWRFRGIKDTTGEEETFTGTITLMR
jgi:gliding motility-associated-like protein